MFVDCIQIQLTAGKGGNGAVSWRREKFIPKGGPTGGNGGPGGSVVIICDSHALSLEEYRRKKILTAENGASGSANQKNGRRGQDLIIKVPLGTLVKDAATKEVLFDFDEPSKKWIACTGGKGGLGNHFFRTPTHQAPNFATPGKEGTSITIELELKLIADVGLIGMPNAGKSSLMKRITHTEVKIGAYPFTTLHPNLGSLEFEDYSRLLIADIPGIIEEAHLDKGLGLAFLRHIERTSILIYVIDISGEEGRDPLDDFRILKQELHSYSTEILTKPFLVALNKMDKEPSKEQALNFRKNSGVTPAQIFEVSAETKEGLSLLLEALQKLPANNYSLYKI